MYKGMTFRKHVHSFEAEKLTEGQLVHNVKGTRDADCRVPRDEIQGRRLSEAHPFDELGIERKLNIDR